MSDRLRKIETERRLTDELATCEDDEETDPDGLSKANEAAIGLDKIVPMVGLLLNIFKTNTANTAVVRERDKEPDGASDAEEDRGEEEAVVVSKPGDGG